MSEKTSETKKPKLTFEGKQYNIDDLSEDTKEIVRGLQIAETQLKMHQDTWNVLGIGRKALGMQLKQQLNDVTPIEEDKQEA